MIPRSVVGLWIVLLLRAATAHAELGISYPEALSQAKRRSPSVAVIGASEQVAEADSRVAGVYPNPALSVGTATDSAHLSLGVSVPLVLLGQRGAALAAGRAEYALARLDGSLAMADLRAATARAFVTLWLAERASVARLEAARVSERLEASVRSRVEVGAAPTLEGLRAHADRLRLELDARSAEAAVDVAAANLAFFIGSPSTIAVRAVGDPGVPNRLPDLQELSEHVARTPSVRRALLELRASEARASSERAQVRPLMSLDFGADFDDPTTPGVTNYHAQLAVEVPLFNQRGPQIEREERKAARAQHQVRAEQARLLAELSAGFRTFNLLTDQTTTLEKEVLPAADEAASAVEESYALGRAALVAVLDAERARIDAKLALVESQGARANAWIEIEHALGVQ